MTDLPEPLVEAEVDLTDFPFMPIMIAQLLRSRAWLICKRKPQLAYYMLNLWMAAWHGRPAASVENDDLVLSDVAGCDERTWAKVKSEVLRGWVQCSDGRLYHPVVADRARESWERKLARRTQTESARLAREAKRLRENAAIKAEVERLSAASSFNATSSVTDAVTNSVAVNATSSKRERQGEGQGQGERNRSSLRSDRAAIDDAFGKFSSIFPKDDAPDDVRRELARRLDEGVALDDILSGARRYAEECRSENRAKKHIAAPARWLEGGRWLDGKPKAEVVLPVVKKGTPQGDAWERYLGKSNIWIDGRRTVATEWPPESQESAA